MWFYAVELQTSVSSDTVFFSLKAVQEIYRSMEVIQELIANSNLDLAKAMFAPKTVIKPLLQEKNVNFCAVTDSGANREIANIGHY